MRSFMTRVGHVVAWVVIGAVAGCLVAAVLVPRVAGATPYTILTGSMRPSFPPGTLVVVKPIDADDIVTGDIVTYQLRSGQAPVVTHRVVEVGHTLDGDVRFTTQGDANSAADADPVMPVQIRGKLWYSVPYLGRANQLLSGSQRQTAVYVVAGLLLAYAAYTFTSSVTDRRSSRKKKEAT